MGKRQYRISGKDVEQHTMELLTNNSVQIIMRNRTVLQGKVLSLNAVQLEVQDGRRSRQRVQLQEIEEIIYDKEASC